MFSFDLFNSHDNLFLKNEYTQTFLEYLSCGICINDWTETMVDGKHVSTLYISVPEKSSKALAGKELAKAFKDYMLFLFGKGGGKNVEFTSAYGNIDEIKVKYQIRAEEWNSSKYERRKSFITLLDEIDDFMPEYRGRNP